MKRIARRRRSVGRLAYGISIGILLALGAVAPAFAVVSASSQLCYGYDCSKMGYDVYVASVTDDFHRDVLGGIPGQTGYFDENAFASAAARQVTFEVSFLGGELTPDVFLASSPGHPKGSFTLIAFLGATGEDELTITAPGLTNGFVSLDVSLQAGGVNSCTAVGGCSVGLPFVPPDLNAQFFAQAGSDDAGNEILDVSQLTATGGFSHLYTSAQIPFVAGTPFSVRLGISGTMSLRALYDAATPPDHFISDGNLGATATIEQLHVFDANHQPLENVSISSATGTDWTTVPEAPGLASDFAATVGLVALQRRARPRHRG